MMLPELPTTEYSIPNGCQMQDHLHHFHSNLKIGNTFGWNLISTEQLK